MRCSIYERAVTIFAGLAIENVDIKASFKNNIWFLFGIVPYIEIAPNYVKPSS
jgi:hypothetical protein